MTSEAAIIGCGARTPVGLNRHSSAAAVRAGISRIAEHPFILDRFGEPVRVARDGLLDPLLEGHQRLLALAIPAARAALAPLDGRIDTKVVVALGHGNERPGHDKKTGVSLVGSLADALRPLVRIEDMLHSGEGHAAGIWAMQMAQQLISTGRVDAVLAGAVDSYMSRDTLEWLDDHEQLHSDENIYGFSPGEAAGFLLITRPDVARRLTLRPLAGLISVGVGFEPNRIKTEQICLGEGLASVFREATKSLQDHEQIDRIICDMNGERYRGNEYGFAVLKCPGRFKAAANFEAPADSWGDVGAASGPLYASLVIEAEARGYAKGPLNLIWASSETGMRGAALLHGSGGS